jgi:hypothetical protein
VRATREGACCMPGRGRTLRAYSHGREYTWRSHGHAGSTVQMGAIALVQMYHSVLMRVVAMQVRRSVHVADAATRRSCSRACEHGGRGRSHHGVRCNCNVHVGLRRALCGAGRVRRVRASYTRCNKCMSAATGAEQHGDG